MKAEAEAGKGPGPMSRLYHGETSFDFVGRRRVWFTISALIILAGIISLGFRGLNLGIEFKGGTAWIVQDVDADAGPGRELGDGGRADPAHRRGPRQRSEPHH